MLLRSLCSFIAVAALLTLAAGQAAALSVTVGFESVEGSFMTRDDAMLGCQSSGGLGQLSCAGGGWDNGGWSVDSWNLDLDPDPTINSVISVTNNTLATQTFVVPEPETGAGPV